jgi:hypothetical protein
MRRSPDDGHQRDRREDQLRMVRQAGSGAVQNLQGSGSDEGVSNTEGHRFVKPAALKIIYTVLADDVPIVALEATGVEARGARTA